MAIFEKEIKDGIQLGHALDYCWKCHRQAAREWRQWMWVSERLGIYPDRDGQACGLQQTAY